MIDLQTLVKRPQNLDAFNTRNTTHHKQSPNQIGNDRLTDSNRIAQNHENNWVDVGSQSQGKHIDDGRGGKGLLLLNEGHRTASATSKANHRGGTEKEALFVGNDTDQGASTVTKAYVDKHGRPLRNIPEGLRLVERRAIEDKAYQNTDYKTIIVMPTRDERDIFLAEMSQEELDALGQGYDEDSQKKESHYDNAWAGLSFGAGSFELNPTNSTGTNGVAFSQTSDRENNIFTAENAQEQTGASFALGVDFGKKVARKWVVQSGIQYAYNESASEGILRVTDRRGQPNPSAVAGSESFSNRNAEFDFELFNTLELLSLPVRAGYIVYENDKVGFLVSAGVSTDVFIDNSVQERTGQFTQNDLDLEQGAEFRTVNFSGLFGGEVFYRFGGGYTFAVEPSYREALNRYTKDSEDVSSKPSWLGVGFRLRYEF